MRTRTLPSIEESSVWHPYTAIPVLGPRTLMARAQGPHVYDVHGKAYFDATSSWWCNLHGHCHPDLVRALSQQAAELDQILFAPHAHPVALDFADALLNKAEGFSKVFFSDDGSTAVEAALKMALQYWELCGEPRRKQFLSLERGYHGDTLGAIRVGHLDEFHQSLGPRALSTRKSTVPYCYRCPLGLRYPSCQIACLDQARSQVESDSDEIAALIVEPLLLGAGGMIPYPKEYLDTLVSVCRKKNILVIFDEVFTGFGRTGTFFAYQQLSQKPDIVCLSKGLTSGMLALGATLTTRDIFDVFTGGEQRKFFHGHTFTANALACAVGLESLKIFDRENVIERNDALSRFMVSQTPRFEMLAHVGNVRHLGMVWAMELVKDRETRREFKAGDGPLWKIATKMWKRGVWVRPLGSVLYVIPPYCSTVQDLEKCFDVLYSETSREEHYAQL